MSYYHFNKKEISQKAKEKATENYLQSKRKEK